MEKGTKQMTTLILLGLLAYVWVAAVLVMAELDDGWRFWDRSDWAMFAAYPMVLPVAFAVGVYDYVRPLVIRAATKVKQEAKNLYNWVTGRD